MTRTYIRTDKNGTKYYTCTDKCAKCNGTGFIKYYAYIANGECFDCGGSGVVEWEEKEYTPEYEKKQAERRERLLAKKQAELEAKAIETNKKFLANNGFDESGRTYFILGNTYSVKDDLKAQGAKWDNASNHWHIDHKIEGFELVEVMVDEMYDKVFGGIYSRDGWKRFPDTDEDGNPVEDHYVYKIERAEQELKDSKRKSENGNSEYLGKPGDKLNLVVTYVFTTSWENSYAPSYSSYKPLMHLHTFKDENGNVLIWKTSSYIDAEIGDKMNLFGIVKDHSEYKEVKQTVMTRCKVTALG